MKDLYNREIDYMRVSVTDRCNLRCTYCMPDGIACLPAENVMTYGEITAVCREAASLGISRIKVTGGEPLVRRDCHVLIRMLKELEGIRQVTLTTNGVLLAEAAEHLKAAGLDAVNVSLDTTDRAQFRAVTGSDRLGDVMAGIQRALELQMKVKINTVLQPGLNEECWENVLLLARDNPLDVRFIEMMPIGQGRGLESVSNEELLRKMQQTYSGMKRDLRVHGNGPAVYWTIPGFAGSVGFISAIHGKFCDCCNRIRMTADGILKPCLCYEDGISIKKAAECADIENMRRILEETIRNKPQAHCFEREDTVTEQRKMAQIGG